LGGGWFGVWGDSLGGEQMISTLTRVGEQVCQTWLFALFAHVNDLDKFAFDDEYVWKL
jgi:hypothetical protein